jgi:hypothetical protein
LATGTRTTARPKRASQGGAVKQIIGIIAGGLIAAPVAQMILMWMPGNWQRQQRDPLGVAPKIAAVIPWIVPKSLRTDEEGSVHQPTQPAVAQRPDRTGQGTTVTGTGGNVSDPPGGLNRPELTEALKPTGEKPKDPPEGNGNENLPNPDPFNPTAPDPTTDPDPLDPSATDDPPATSDPPMNEGPKLGPKVAPEFAAADLLEQIKVGTQAKALIDQAAAPEGEGRSAKAGEFMEKMNELAHVVTFAKERPTGHVEHLDDMLANASNSDRKRTIVATLGEAEFKKKAKDRPTNGLIFVGTVKDIQSRDQLFEVIVELHAKSKKPVSVYSKSNPTAGFAVGDMVIFLGEIFDKPNQQIDGYKGPDEPVIWGGYSQVIKP